MRIDMSVMSVDSDTQEVQGLQTILRKSTVSAGQLVIQGLGELTEHCLKKSLKFPFAKY